MRTTIELGCGNNKIVCTFNRRIVIVIKFIDK